jgi:TetR/AcrR family transcriptional regulator, transcriptional repressor for nem operon
MPPAVRTSTRGGDTRNRLLAAATDVIRSKGLSATTIDDICDAAGLTKGAFFHHFASKEALAVAAAGYWSQMTGALFAGARYHHHPEPAQRVLAYIDFRATLIAGSSAEYTCLVGTMVQEAFATSPSVRAACEASITGHTATLEADISAALAAAGRDIDAASLARHTQVVLQGAFILGKATNDSTVVTESIGHLRRYFEYLFHLKEDGTMSDTSTPQLPVGMHQLSPHLVCAGAAEAIDFYVAAFAAVEMMRVPGPDEKLMHARLVINGSSVLLMDEYLDFGARSPKSLGGSSVTIHLIVPDVDAWVARAMEAGATVTMPVDDMFWGDRYGVVQDPFGHNWSIATPQRVMSADEIARSHLAAMRGGMS